jgi:hypothetical protein
METVFQYQLEQDRRAGEVYHCRADEQAMKKQAD